MGALILNGATHRQGLLIAAGALVPQGVVVPPRSLVTGVPGAVRRELSDAEIANNRYNAEVLPAADRPASRLAWLGRVCYLRTR